MPRLGLGAWKMKDEDETAHAVRTAVSAGYRSIDTASIYGNEESLGRAILQCGLPRDELFITTKLWNKDHSYSSTFTACEDSLRNFGLDYLDLYLIHWPVAQQYQEIWEAFVQLRKEGKVRAIGVSNFQIHHLTELMSTSSVVPAVNQVEFHPWLTQGPLLAFCNKHRIQVEAWSPLMQGHFREIPELAEIAACYSKSVPQIILRWNLQKEVITIPKSVHTDRIIENANIFDFHLHEEHMRCIDALNQDQRFGDDPDHFQFRD
ncbi:aldo/keto reductase [Paenibacillus albidus]|uniref:aldo/keto reductase n=1 Tax=Paenibacillus albidus TaxID=2041023 RepID=UPI001BECA091|nr:aldo/keto reductase [Paenibacillus albidus]MBT2290153.1 aldo/keto reductase [Paenibacillus albidus]